MKTSVLGLLLLLTVLGFSGCSSKPSIVMREFCEGQEYPIRVSSEAPVCQHIRDIEEKVECASKKYVTLEADYKNLESYVRNCK